MFICLYVYFRDVLDFLDLFLFLIGALGSTTFLFLLLEAPPFVDLLFFLGVVEEDFLFLLLVAPPVFLRLEDFLRLDVFLRLVDDDDFLRLVDEDARLLLLEDLRFVGDFLLEDDLLLVEDFRLEEDLLFETAARDFFLEARESDFTFAIFRLFEVFFKVTPVFGLLGRLPPDFLRLDLFLVVVEEVFLRLFLGVTASDGDFLDDDFLDDRNFKLRFGADKSFLDFLRR